MTSCILNRNIQRAGNQYYITALNNIAFQNAPTLEYIFPALSNTGL